DLMIMDAGIIDLRRQPKNGGCKASDPGKEIVGSDHPIMLRGDEADASIEQCLNGIQYVQGRTLADLSLIAYSIESPFGVSHLPLGRLRLRLGGIELSPILYHIGSHLDA